MIKSSPFFHSPAIAQASSNLAALFEPPSGADAAGWATAKAKREEASRLADLYSYVDDPNFNQTLFDRRNIAAGQYNPTQGYYAQDQNNATARYGLDLGAETSRSNNAADNERERYGIDVGDAAQRYGYDVGASTSRSNNAADNDRHIRDRQMQEEGSLQRLYAAPVEVAPGETVYLPGQTAAATGLSPMLQGNRSLAPGETMYSPGGDVLRGEPKPLSETEWDAFQKERLFQSGKLVDQDLLDAIAGDNTPVQAVGPDGRATFMSPGAAIRTRAEPYTAAQAEKMDNFLAIGPDNEEFRFLGYIGPDGRVYDANTQQAVPNVVRKESTGGGMSFETDGQGGIKLSTGNQAGNTTARVTDLQRQESEAGRAVNELTSLFETLRPDDLGAAGNINQFLTDYGAQVIPSLARPDVAGTRAQLDATTLGLARSIIQDDRLSDGDRKAVNEIMVSRGLGESLPGARAKLASLIAISAYRKKYANTVRVGGETLPPLDRAMLGRLVDEKAISPSVAQAYAENVLSRAPQPPGSLIPGVTVPQTAAPAARPSDGIRAVASPEEAMTLPPGTKFRTPDGRVKVRP